MSEQLLGKGGSFAGDLSFNSVEASTYFSHPQRSCWRQYPSTGQLRVREGTGTCSLEFLEFHCHVCVCVGVYCIVTQVSQLNTEDLCVYLHDCGVWLCPCTKVPTQNTVPW